MTIVPLYGHKTGGRMKEETMNIIAGLERWTASARGVTATVVSGVFVLWAAYYHLTDTIPQWDPSWVTFFISGLPLYYIGLYWLGKRELTSALLVSIAMTACIALGEVFAAAEVAWIMALGEILEEKTVARARRGLTEVLGSAPQSGCRLRADGSEEVVAVTAIAVGDRLRVRPGETIPVDGEVLTGASAVNEAMLTGESYPADKAEGSPVYGGTVNGFGALTIRATKVGQDTSFARLARLLQEAEENTAPVQRTVDRWVTWLVPTAIIFALTTFVVTWALGVPVAEATVRAVTVLVVFCPCALALATPTAVVAGIGQATRYGVIIKSGAALEEMGRTTTVAIDKTGTMTTGEITVAEVWPRRGVSADEVIAVAAAAERESEHPLAAAIRRKASARGLVPEAVRDFVVASGKGVSAVLADGRAVHVGSEGYLESQGVAVDEKLGDTVHEARLQGMIVVWVARGDECLGAVGLADTLRPQMERVVGLLRARGIRTVMLTGDNAETAAHVGVTAHVDEVHARLLPDGKTEHIRSMQAAGARVAMVGDGINDAAALRTAHTGIAIGGTAGDMAIEAADIVLPGQDMMRLPYLVSLAQATLRTIHINLFIALGLNIAGVVLSFFGLLSPVTGAIVHNGGGILVALHAISLYERKRNPGEPAPVTAAVCTELHCHICGGYYCIAPGHQHPLHRHG